MTTWTIDTSELDALLRAFTPELRGRLHMAGARAVARLCRQHLRQEGQRRHASANRLGAVPSKHFEQATVHAEASADDAHVLIALPGLSRAFGAITVTPKRAKALTLPVAAEAYGKKASEMGRDGWALFTAKSLRGLLLGKRKAIGEVKALYLLRARVRLPQDRTLLPSDAALAAATCDGMITRLRSLVKG